MTTQRFQQEFQLKRTKLFRSDYLIYERQQRFNKNFPSETIWTVGNSVDINILNDSWRLSVTIKWNGKKEENKHPDDW